MSTVISSEALALGLSQEFRDAYSKRPTADSRLGQILDIIPATARTKKFAYFESAPYLTYWRRGDTVPTSAFGSVGWTTPVYEFAKAIEWHKNDRKDDQLDSLYEQARTLGQAAAIVDEQLAFDLIEGGTSMLPAAVTAPDGAAFFNATDGGGSARFGVSGGNVVSGSGVASVAAILTDFYAAITRFVRMQDTQGQPLHMPEAVAGGFVVVAPAQLQYVMDQAFFQMRQGIVYGSNTAAAAVTSIVQDASRNVDLWVTPRLSDVDDWYVFLKNPPKKPMYTLDREGLIEQTALEGDNNSDQVRKTGIESIQFEVRKGAGLGPVYGAVQISN